MATKAATTADATETREEGGDGPLMDDMGQAVKKLIVKAKERGYVTYDELNSVLPPDQTSSEQIEDVMAGLSEMGINVIENEESEEAAPAEPDREGEPRASGNLDDDDIGRTDDPVRMYLREMGSVELLSREGEIAIAKRIEAGREMMIGGICESPLTIRAIIQWHSALKDGKMLLRDIIDLDATYGAGPDGPQQAADEAPKLADDEEEKDTEAEAGPEGEKDTADGDDDEDDDPGISLSAMEEALKPSVLETFDDIEKTYGKLHKVQQQRLGSLLKGEQPTKQIDNKYVKLKAQLVDQMESVRLNNARIEQLVEQLYRLNRTLLGMEGKLLRLALDAKVKRQSFLEQYYGHELTRPGSTGCRPSIRTGGRFPSVMPTTWWFSAIQSARLPTRPPCRCRNTAASSRPSRRARRRRAAPRRKWWKPICGWSSPSLRNTPTAGCSSWT